MPSRKASSSNATADSVKVKGNLHWVAARFQQRSGYGHWSPTRPKFACSTACSKSPPPAPAAKAMTPRIERCVRRALERNFLDDLKPPSGTSRQTITAQLEACLKDAHQTHPEERFQFERHGYFVADRVDFRNPAHRYSTGRCNRPVSSFKEIKR
jgi:glutaminyl-tRNA synthetase